MYIYIWHFGKRESQALQLRLFGEVLESHRRADLRLWQISLFCAFFKMKITLSQVPNWPTYISPASESILSKFDTVQQISLARRPSFLWIAVQNWPCRNKCKLFRVYVVILSMLPEFIWLCRRASMTSQLVKGEPMSLLFACLCWWSLDLDRFKILMISSIKVYRFCNCKFLWYRFIVKHATRG